MMAAHAIFCEAGQSGMNLVGFDPTVDNLILPQHPFFSKASLVSADVPVKIGSTRTEYTGLIPDVALWHLYEEGVHAQVNKLLGNKSNEMINLYCKLNPGNLPSDTYFLIASDYSYTAPILKIAEYHAAPSKWLVYLYYFAWETLAQDGMMKSPLNLEWLFTLDNIKICNNLTADSLEAMALSDKVSDTLIVFTRTGNPNNPQKPKWNRSIQAIVPPWYSTMKSRLTVN